MLIKSIKLNEYIFTSETFFVVSLINLIIFSLLTAYNSRFKFPLIQSALINVSCYIGVLWKRKFHPYTTSHTNDTSNNESDFAT